MQSTLSSRLPPTEEITIPLWCEGVSCYPRPYGMQTNTALHSIDYGLTVALLPLWHMTFPRALGSSGAIIIF